VSNLGEIGSFALDGQRVCERRRHKRKSVLSELGELVVVSLDSERGLLLTLSASGISVQAQAQLTPGSRHAVQFPLPLSEAAIRTTCEVVWTGHNCDAGLKILSLAENDGRALENWLSLHAAEPENVLAGAAPAGIPCAVMDEAGPVSSAYEELAATIEMLVAPQPVDLEPAPPEPPAAAEAATLEDLLPRIIVQARVLTQAEGAALVLRGEEGLICRASSGTAPALGSRMRAGSGLSGECFRLGQVVRCDDVENDPRVNSAAAQRLQSRSILIAPIQVNASTCGVLQVLSSRPFAFNAAHVATLEHLAGVVGALLAAESQADVELTPLSEEAPSAAFLEPTESAAEPAVPDDPKAESVGVAADSPTEETSRNAIVALPETASQPFETAEEQPHSAAGLLRNGAIGCLGLLTTGLLLWTMVQSPQPTKAALPATSAQLTPVSTLTTSATQPPAIGSDPVKAIAATRPVVRPNRPIQAAKSAGGAPESKSASKSQSVVSENRPSLSLRSLPSLPDQSNGAGPVPMTAVLSAPTPALVAPPSPFRQSAGVERGRVISQPKPVYPQAALRAGIEGSVVLATTIGTDGKIKKVNVVSGQPLLAQAAMDAVKQWRYQPSYLNGASVEVDSTITLNFKRP
jgi:TonB family protein